MTFGAWGDDTLPDEPGDGEPGTPEGCPTSYCILDRGHADPCAQNMREVELLAERDDLREALRAAVEIVSGLDGIGYRALQAKWTALLSRHPAQPVKPR